MSFSQCAADFSCLNAPRDEARIHNALSGFMCLPMSAVWHPQAVIAAFGVVLISWLFINEGTVSQALFSIITAAQLMVDMSQEG